VLVTPETDKANSDGTFSKKEQYKGYFFKSGEGYYETTESGFQNNM
jgi:hypothetical protein